MQDLSQYTVADQARLILGAGDGFIELRGKRPGDRTVKYRGWYSREQLDALERRIAGLPDVDVWVGAAPRRERNCGDAEDILPAWCVWADCDTAESCARLRAFHPRPTLVVQSSSGRKQAWWALERPLAVDAIKPALARLRAALDGDKSCVDAARVMRPIGGTNNKRAKPEPVVCKWFTGEVHDIDTVLAACPEAERSPTGEFPAPVDPVPHGHRHDYLKNFGERLVRAGITDRETIEAHLWFEFYRACEQTDDEPRTIAGLAKWWSKSKIAQRENAMAELMARLPEDSIWRRAA